MTMIVCGVESCGRQTHDRICGTCLDQLVTDLRSLVHGGRRGADPSKHGLLRDLDITLMRGQRFSSSAGVRSRGAETPVVFHEGASEARWVLRDTVSSWARDVATANPHLSLTAHTTGEAALWLTRVPSLLAQHSGAPAMFDEITSAVAQVRRVVDRPEDRVYLGVCGADVLGETCTRHLYAMPYWEEMVCPECGTEWSLGAKQAALLSMVEDEVIGATKVSRLLHALGIEVASSTIRMYARPRTSGGQVYPPKIWAAGKDDRGRPLYRVGDVLDAFLDSQKKPGVKACA